MSGTQLKMSSAYHPQTDGQTEVVNRCIEQYLRCFVHQQPRKWHSFLPWAEFWYNTTYHSSAGMTPFQALYGRPPPTIPHYNEGHCQVNEVDSSLTSRDALLRHLKENLHAANNRMKQQADSKRRDIEYHVGDCVFLKLHPYRRQTVFKRGYQKLASRFYGPYQIEERIGNVAYKLKLPQSSRIHPVFHVSLLKKKVGTSITTSTDLSPVAEAGQLILEPEAILDSQSLIKWKRLPEEDATWENTEEFNNKFLNLNLEDKVQVKGKGIDKPPRRSQRMPVKNPKYLD
ncbi:hypothetical protein ACOSP7_013981 [Xanthoceras sorbifolium]